MCEPSRLSVGQKMENAIRVGETGLGLGPISVAQEPLASVDVSGRDPEWRAGVGRVDHDR